MTGMLRNIGFDNEPFALISGVLAIITSLIFFLQKFQLIAINIPITDLQYLYFFAGFTFFSGVVHFMTTLGFIGTK